MQHTYHIHGMTCNGCRSHVQESLAKVKGVITVSVDLEKEEATIEMDTHIPIDKFQEALKYDGGGYNIYEQGEHHHTKANKMEAPKAKGMGTFFCPMHCEGDKVYDEPGDCPVCGMDLVEEQNVASTTLTKYTCPMHPEIARDQPGS